METWNGGTDLQNRRPPHTSSVAFTAAMQELVSLVSVDIVLSRGIEEEE